MIDKMLDYQTLDSELLKYEKEFQNNKDKKQANLMTKFVKDASEKTRQLNKEASRLSTELEKIEEVEKKGVSFVEKLVKQDINKLEVENLKELEIKITNASRNLKDLEKRLGLQKQKIQNVLKEFENTKKKVYLARQKYKQHKGNYDDFKKEVEPKLNEVKKQLEEKEKNLDKELLAKYKELRKDGVFPVIVALKDQSCGGCRTNLPSSTLERIKEKGQIRCENCNRIIYTK